MAELLRRGRQRRPATRLASRLGLKVATNASTERPPTATCDLPAYAAFQAWWLMLLRRGRQRRPATRVLGVRNARIGALGFYGEAANGDLRPRMAAGS